MCVHEHGSWVTKHASRACVQHLFVSRWNPFFLFVGGFHACMVRLAVTTLQA
jgi:hypothetical protein